MTTQTITLIPLSQLVLAPENARAATEHDAASIRTLAGSITAIGGLLDPLKAYVTGDRAAVWDGGRRLAALNALQTLPPGLSDGIPVILTDQTDAALASAATFVREDQHPVDQFLTWNALHEAGQSPDMIAAACGATPREVAKLLRFAMLAPDVLAAFKAGRFDFEVATAFTLTDDHEKQRQVLASFGDKAMGEWQVRQALKAQTVDASDRRAQYVGRDAYAAAGGRFITDLFTHGQIDEAWADEDLLNKLYNDKLDQLFTDLQAEGWGEVKLAGDRWGQGWREGYDAMAPEGDDGDHTDEQRARGTALVVFNYQGACEVKRGYVKATAQGRSKDAAATPAKSDPARYGFGHAGHQTITTVATRATQAAVARRPDVAYDAVVAHLAWSALNPHAGGNVSTLTVPYSHSRAFADAAVHAALDEWRERLPSDRVAFWTAVADLSAEEKASLLAVAFAATLDAVEPKNDARQPARWATLGLLATRAEVDFAAAWTPGADFLKGGSRDALQTVIANPAFADAKKGVLVERAAQLAESTGWVPQLLRDLVTPPEATAKASKPAKGKSGTKARPAT